MLIITNIIIIIIIVIIIIIIIWNMVQAVILLQIVMVSAGTHLVKNHEPQSWTNESQLTKMSPKMKMHGPL